MFETTRHAAVVIAARNIRPEWIESALTHPALVQPDANDSELEHRLAVIADCGMRVLRVIVKRNVQPRLSIGTRADWAAEGERICVRATSQ
jgi:hypothetical protein